MNKNNTVDVGDDNKTKDHTRRTQTWTPVMRKKVSSLRVEKKPNIG